MKPRVWLDVRRTPGISEHSEMLCKQFGVRLAQAPRMSILSDLPLSERPRERLSRDGPQAMQDIELLAVVLGTGLRGEGAVGTAGRLLARFGDLRRLGLAGIGELASVPGVGVAKACRVKAMLALAGRLAERPFVRGEHLTSPRDVFEKVGRRLLVLEREVFTALALDVKHRVLAEHHVADGGACSVEIIPRDVFCVLVREAAAAVVFVHNHPSGDPTPSLADKELTRKLTLAGDLIGIKVVDHVIAAQEGFYAFSEGRVTASN